VFHCLKLKKTLASCPYDFELPLKKSLNVSGSPMEIIFLRFVEYSINPISIAFGIVKFSQLSRVK